MIYKYNESNKKIVSDRLNIINVFNNEFSDFDYVVANLDGEHGSCINTKSTKCWIILEGTAKVYLNDEVSQVSQGDFIIINKNVKHNIIGKVKFGVVCTPPFDSAFEKYD